MSGTANGKSMTLRTPRAVFAAPIQLIASAMAVREGPGLARTGAMSVRVLGFIPL